MFKLREYKPAAAAAVSSSLSDTYIFRFDCCLFAFGLPPPSSHIYHRLSLMSAVDIAVINDNHFNDNHINEDHNDDDDDDKQSITIGRQSTSGINWSSLLNLVDDPDLADLLSSAVDSAARTLRYVIKRFIVDFRLIMMMREYSLAAVLCVIPFFFYIRSFDVNV